MAHAREGTAEQAGCGGHQAHVVVAVDLVPGDVGERDVADARPRVGQLEEVHAVDQVELGVDPHDVGVDEPRRAERAQRQLQRARDVEVQRRLADVAGHERIVECSGRRLEQPHADGVGEPGVLIAQLRLATLKPGGPHDLIDRLAPTLSLDVGEHEPARQSAGLAPLASLRRGRGRADRVGDRGLGHEFGFGRSHRGLDLRGTLRWTGRVEPCYG
jgi:hypothetical protein